MNTAHGIPACPFCLYIIKGPVTVLSEDSTCVVQRGSHFALIPDDAPVVPFHLLVVSCKHSCRSIMAKQDQGGELADMKEAVRLFNRRTTGFETMFFEHGSCVEESGSSCLVHGHLHAVPLSQEHRTAVFREVLRLLGCPDAAQIESSAYLYAEFVEGQGLYWSDVLKRRQFFRLLIAQATGNADRARWQTCLSNERLSEAGARWKNECVKAWRDGAS